VASLFDEPSDELFDANALGVAFRGEEAGASELGIGSELLSLEALRMRKQSWIFELAQRFVGIVAEARTQLKDWG
jgi:hypothetical protein